MSLKLWARVVKHGRVAVEARDRPCRLPGTLPAQATLVTPSSNIAAAEPAQADHDWIACEATRRATQPLLFGAKVAVMLGQG